MLLDRLTKILVHTEKMGIHLSRVYGNPLQHTYTSQSKATSLGALPIRGGFDS